MRPAYCKIVEIKFLRDEDGNQANDTQSYTYNFEEYMKAALSGKPERIDNAERRLRVQRKAMCEGLASKGVSLNVYIEDIDVMKVYYIPIFERKEEYTSSTPAKLAKGDTDFMQIKGLSSDEVVQYYNDSLGYSPRPGEIRSFNMSDPSIFDVVKDEPKLKFSKGDRPNGGYQGPSSAGFKDAKVIGWRKMYMPLNSTKHPDVKDFIYITTDSIAEIMTYATQKLTDAKSMGVIIPFVGDDKDDTWHKMSKDLNDNNDVVLNAGAGAGGGAVANPGAAGALQDTDTHFIMRITSNKGQYDGTFDKAGFLPAATALGAGLLGGLLGGLLSKKSGDKNENNTTTSNNYTTINNYYENWTAKVLPIEFYVLQPSYLQNSQTGYKPGKFLNFSETYSDWVRQWSSCATLWFYRYDGVVALGAAPYEYEDYEGNGVRINFDGRWSYLPTPPECGGVSGADSYFGKFDFSSRSFSPVAVSADVGEEGAIATESIGKTLKTISVPVSLSAGSKTPTLKDLEINYNTDEKNPSAVARLYAMYSMKFFVGYYVYDYNVGKWMQAGDGFWKLYGESFPAISGYALPSAGTAGIGTSSYTYGGTWTEPAEALPSAYAISMAMILDKADSGNSGDGGSSPKDSGITEVAPDSIASADWQKNHPVLGPRSVYATYKTRKVTFEWYVYKFDAGGESGEWELFHKSEPFDMRDAPFEVDPKFVEVHDEKVGDSAGGSSGEGAVALGALDLLDGKYAYLRKWLLISDNSKAPTEIIKDNDSFVKNCGTTFSYSQFKNHDVKTIGNSTRATYVFYAIYDEKRSFNVEFYTLEGGESLEWKKLEPPKGGDYVWSGLVADNNAESVDIKLPDLGEKRRIEFTDGDAKGTYDFADCWMLGVRAGAPGAVVVLENGSASLSVNLSNLGYEISPSVVEGVGAVSGLIDTSDESNKKDKLVLKLLDRSKSSTTVCKLYAIYDRLYKVRFNLIGVKKAPENDDEEVSWKDIFTANVKFGDRVSVDALKNDDGKTVQDILDSLSDDEKFMLNPQWDLSSDTSSYGFTKLWLNPGSDVAMKVKDKGGIPFCFFSASRPDAADAYTMLWHLTEDDDSRGSKKATGFSPDVFKCDEDGVADFYAVYTLNNKAYAVRFFVPDVSASSESAIVWKDITPPEGEGDCIGRVEFGTPYVEVTIPDMKDYARIVFDKEINDNESGAKVKGKYDYAYCWIKDSKVGWNNYIFLKEQMDKAGTVLGTTLNKDEDAGSVSGVVSGTDPAKLTVILNKNDKDTEYYLYATYDKVYVVKFHLIGSNDYPADGAAASWGAPIFEKEIKLMDTISVDTLKNKDSKSVNDVIEGIKAGDFRLAPSWDLSLETVLAPGGKYAFQSLWLNPAKDNAMSVLANAANCFLSLIDPDLNDKYKTLWHLTSADDARSTRKSDKFKLEGTLFNLSGDYEDEVVFYGVYALNVKPYAVEFYMPDESSSGSELKWKKITKVSGWVAFGEPEANAKLPDSKSFEKVKLDTDEFKGSYMYDKLWLVEQTENWYSGVTVRKSVEGSTIATAISTTVGLVAGAPNTSLDVVLAKNDAATLYKLYAVYDKVFEVEFYFVQEKYQTAPTGDAAVNWGEPVFTSTIKEGGLMCVDKLLSNGKKVTDVVSERLGAEGEDPLVRPIWGLIGGKTYQHAYLWFNPPEGDGDKDVLKAGPADKYCFADDGKDNILEQAWDLLDSSSDAAGKKPYKSKSAEVFLPYDTNGSVYSVAKDGKVKFYSVYIPAQGVPYVFYVVSEFNREEFTWTPLKFKAPSEKEEMEYHIAEFKTAIPDPEDIKEIGVLPSYGYGSATLDVPNKLVFKGWRQIDPSCEFDPSAESESDTTKFVKKCYDVDKAENKNGLLYNCACQRVKEKDNVEKANFYWDKGSFVGPTVAESEIRKPYIYVAVYEYQQNVHSIWTADPEYKNVQYDANHTSAYGETDPQNRLRQVELVLSAGKNWDMSVTRTKFRYSSDTITNEGSKTFDSLVVGDKVNLKDPYALDVAERDTIGNYTTIFKYKDVFECAIWWITNPSGFEFPFAFYTKYAKIHTFKMPTSRSGSPTYIPSETPTEPEGENGGTKKRRR